MQANICSRTKRFGFTNHQERLVAERRVGCKPSKKPDQGKPSQLETEQLPRLHEAGQYSDQKAAQHIYHQGPVRKGRESGPAVHESVQSKTEQGTRESARTNQDRSDQSRFQYCTRLLFTGRLHRLTSQTSGNLK